MKLTDKQKEILKLMNSGWQLGKNKHIGGNWWIQKGGCGYGGEAKHYNGRNNISKLSQLDLIISDGYNFPTETYHLTEKGKELLERIK